jgi:hypothetical protein
VVVAIAAPAFAQDESRLALVASFPTPTVSVQWEVSDRFGLRIDGSYSYRDESSESRTPGSLIGVGPGGTVSGSIVIPTETTTESTSHNGAIGIAGIFTIRRSDQLRLYVAPRLSLNFYRQRITSTSTVREVPPAVPASVIALFSGTGTFEDSSTSPGAGVSFGAASAVHRRLSLFGEAGFTYSRNELPPVGATILLGPGDSIRSASASSRTFVDTRAVGGVMIRF